MRRYDGLAAWYDETFAGYGRGPGAQSLARALGLGSGLCLDVGCGSGLHFAAIQSTGRSVLGVDVSLDQLAIATTRARLLVGAAAERLPFADATFATAVSTFTHTDVPDFAELVREVARVLRPGGLFVYLGVHPVLVHHAAERTPDGILVKPGYMERGRVESSPVFKKDGLRDRVGEYHLGLDGVLMAFIDSDLRLVRVEELTGGWNVPGETLTEMPGAILVAARR
jgi:SAM-dependent methyltransferase